jgi:hypothetical protein
MNLGTAALLYFGGGILLTFGVVWAYVIITGDDTGEKLVPLTKKVSLYPFTAPVYEPDKYQNQSRIDMINNNTNNKKDYELPTVTDLEVVNNSRSNMTIGELIRPSNAGFMSLPYSSLVQEE